MPLSKYQIVCFEVGVVLRAVRETEVDLLKRYAAVDGVGEAGGDGVQLLGFQELA
ncbi:hypothetical protein GR255_27830 [Mycobacterium tuberculosis]|nr:hypothetical protein [Mycobacterium tuberculosis]